MITILEYEMAEPMSFKDAGMSLHQSQCTRKSCFLRSHGLGQLDINSVILFSSLIYVNRAGRQSKPNGAIQMVPQSQLSKPATRYPQVPIVGAFIFDNRLAVQSRRIGRLSLFSLDRSFTG